MFQRTVSTRSAIALAMVALLAGCGGLEKGPAPDLPYTPEPPKPKTATKKDAPETLGPSTAVPIVTETPGKKEGVPEEKDEATGKTAEPAAATKDGTKDAPDAGKKDEPAKDAAQTTKDADEPKKE